MRLLRAGIDTSVIAHWLGHAKRHAGHGRANVRSASRSTLARIAVVNPAR